MSSEGFKGVPGVPEGWELVGFRVPKKGEWFLGINGVVVQADCDRVNVWPIIRKIEVPKRFRPFANAEEFEPHRDRWVEYTSPNYGDCSMYLVSAYTSERVWLGPDNVGKTYKEAFHCLRFDDGSPFGVEVTE